MLALHECALHTWSATWPFDKKVSARGKARHQVTTPTSALQGKYSSVSLQLWSVVGLKDLDMCDKCTFVTKLSQRGKEGRGGLIRGIMPVPGQMKHVQGYFFYWLPPVHQSQNENANEPTGASLPWYSTPERASVWLDSLFIILVLNKGGPV